ncbi:MAG: trypsin-like peptidase domain-containing protein, partial [Gemmatimonadetes bacterium]|nr:trypsin-like peptidase domain-containing protein [Gemmatimonadota bacterium]
AKKEAAPAAGKPKAPAQAARGGFGGKGKTMFFRELIEETTQKSSRKLRGVVIAFSVMLVGAVGGLWWFSEQRLQETSAQLEERQQALATQQAIADSLRGAANAEYRRLRADLALAQGGSASAAVLDSLRQALIEAQERTQALATSMRRAQGELDAQLARGEAERQQRAAELQSLRLEVAAAASGGVPRGLLDSLRRAVSNAEEQLSDIEGKMRAVSGVDLATVAQTNQGAVGLVSAFSQGRVFDGSGFVITASGFFITNRHVVMHNGLRADSLFVIMADQRRMIRADIINVAAQSGPDIAVIRLRNYTGPHVPRVDWAAKGARQGEPAALIGFPAGLAAALDPSQTIRTSMSGGYFSQVRPDEIRFDGFTVGGSSGSPVLNANGEVVAIHRAGLAEAAGLGFAVPIRLAIPLLPPEVRAEVGIR